MKYEIVIKDTIFEELKMLTERIKSKPHTPHLTHGELNCSQ
jgi:hypothetical protein